MHEKAYDLEKANRKIKGLLDTKTRFINQVAHDLRTPLTPMSILLPIIKKNAEGNLSAENCQNLDVVINNLKYLSVMVGDTLNVAKLDSGNMDFSPEFLKINEVVDEVIANNKIVFTKHVITAQNNIDRELPKIFANRLRTMEVLQNLISNASNFMSDKKREIIIDAKPIEGFMHISVSDTGIGIKKDNLEKVFDEFFKADDARHKRSSGLGLSISKRIVTEMGGKIWAKSEGINKGATFVFTLPLAPKI